MSDETGSLQATNLTDPILALAVYWLRADVMHTLLHDIRDAWLEDAAKHKTEFETYIAFWLSALCVVVEGFNELKLDAAQVPELSDPRVDTLRHFRNGCFHYQRDYQKFAHFLSGDLESFDWAEQLHAQFHAYFASYRAQCPG
jgi:hypothetical protein